MTLTLEQTNHYRAESNDLWLCPTRWCIQSVVGTMFTRANISRICRWLHTILFPSSSTG